MMTLLIIKALISILVVMGLSLVAEHASPRAAGILSGYPLGTAIVLFFFGLEKGPEFAAASAPFALAGLVASQTFVFCYYKGSLGYGHSLVRASATAVCGYLIAAVVLSRLHLSLALSIILPAASVFVFAFLFRQIENRTVAARAPLTLNTILLRAGFSGAIIIAITTLPGMAGPEWSGLFSSFPSTLFPLILIVHFTYGKEHAHTIIKNFPLGLGSLIVYCLSVYAFYPGWGIYAGTCASFFSATLYLGIYSAAHRRLRSGRSAQPEP